MKATAKDLRYHSKELLATVARGEEVIITYRGKAKAKLVSVNNEEEVVPDRDELFGIWKDNDNVKDVDKYVRRIRKGRYK